MYDAVCAACGAQTRIPFVPKNDRPIYCSACFQARR
jgi:CxxC-x17-CxxC domain-containing protein